jgi:hypothetical protein
MATTLFITTAELKRNTILSGSIDTNKFIQYIKIAQDIHIQNYLGSKLYNRLIEGITNTDLNASETILLNDYVKDALIHFAGAEYLPFAAYQVSNGGVYKHTSENSTSVDKNEVDYLVQKERDFAQYYIKRMVDYLCVNSALFPEYLTNEDNDIRPSKDTNYNCGWVL